MALGCGMFTVSGLWLIFNSGSTAEVGAGLLSVIFFGGGGLYAIPKIVRRKFTMILSADGIRQQYAQGTTFIPWADVEKIGLIKIFGNKLVGIRLRTYDQYLNNMSPELAEFTLKTLPYMRLMAKATTLLPTRVPLELWSAFEGNDHQGLLSNFSKVRNLAEALMCTRTGYGYDLAFAWSELDRSLDKFAALLEDYHSHR